MLKRLVLACLLGSLAAMPALAAEDTKGTPQAAGTKPNETVGKITVAEPAVEKAPRRKPKWSNPNLDLTHCLERESNTAIIKCAE